MTQPNMVVRAARTSLLPPPQVRAHCTSKLCDKTNSLFYRYLQPQNKVSINYISKMLILVLQVLIQQTEDRVSTGRTHTNDGPPARGSADVHAAAAAAATVMAARAAMPAAAIKRGSQRASERAGV